jgi:hypothetical protein
MAHLEKSDELEVMSQESKFRTQQLKKQALA